MAHKWNEAFEKKAQFESLESRIVLSANALSQMATIDIDQTVTDQIQTTSATLNQVHQQTGVNHVHQNYGFQGDGQTVVVIDSGIAWDHYALGGGFGAGYRVVGGWDFAQNDANPFDGGSAGFHGTHVAGIIGSSDANNRGVAAGVDLVALRVFNDNGSGSLEHVRQALAWVNANVNTFANPITTVNLSLGTQWNSNQIPFWANLESQFAQLEAKGIFISVAAGNSFQQYQSVGVSYPAASSHVVPVASHGSNGQISSFSQRNDRVLVAPGESIRSTVPGHLLGQAVSSQFLAASGTSMAAPYVAGASVLLREAMQFMDYETIDQDSIYNYLRQTADVAFDSVTGMNYHNINLRAAMEAIVVDLHGDSAATATSVGTWQGGERSTGTIGTFDDVDALRFTAGRTGTMTLTFDQSHQLNLQAQLHGQAVAMQNDTLTFDVVAGQEYTLLLSTSGGIGHYTIDTSLQATPVSATDLGTTFSRTLSLDNQGEQWFQVTAGRHGIVAFQLANQAGQGSSLQVYNAQQQWLGTATGQGEHLSFQTQAQADQSFLIRVDGNFTAEMHIQNLVSLNNGILTINGTNQSNQIEVCDGAQVQVRVDGMTYEFQREGLQRVQVFAHGGQNELSVVQNHVGQQTAHIHRHHIYVFGSNYIIYANQVQSIDYHGHAQDTVRLFDTAGDDTFTARAGHSEMSGSDYHNQVFGTGRVVGVGSGGFDQANLIGTAGTDTVYSNSVYTTMSSAQHWVLARGFQSISLDGNGGNDLVAAFGSNSNETLTVEPGFSRFQSSTLTREFTGFQQQQFFGVGGQNQATLQGGTAGNTFNAYWNRAFFTSGAQSTYLHGFQSVTALGDTADTSLLFDTVGNDRFDADAGWGRMQGHGYSHQAIGFGLTIARFSSGQDTSHLFNVSGSVPTVQQLTRTTVRYAGGFEVRSVGLANVQLVATPLSSYALQAANNPSGLTFGEIGGARGFAQADYQVSLWAANSTFNGSAASSLVGTGINTADWVASNRTSAPSLQQAGGERTSVADRHVQAVFQNLGADDTAVVYLRPSATRQTLADPCVGDASTGWLDRNEQVVLDQIVDNFFARHSL